MQNDNNKFSFTYSAPTEAERREIESIRRQYKPETEEENKVERLRRLHSRVMGAATAVSLAAGILGSLIFGAGMALALEFEMLLWGVVLSVVGLPPILAAYPLYKRVLAKGKKQHGDEILRLSEELLGNNE